uniref:FBA_2 domain-containing protein n=1 Tax=Steinernema glaseri TaxID=37863 RepID=A0A1I7Y227_9BILA
MTIPSVRHPLWKDIVDLHHRNRVYYKVDFRMEEGGIKHVFVNGFDVDLSINMRTIRKKGRFARIVTVSDVTSYGHLSYFDGVELLGEAETTKLLETAAPLIDPASASFSSIWGSTDCTKLLLTALFKRVYLKRISVKYCGQIAYDFLEDQINNSLFLNYVNISGRNWPKATFDLLTDFLKERPGKRVRIFFDRRIHLDSNYIQRLLDLWKTNGTLHFELHSFENILDKEELLALMNKGKLSRDARNDEMRFFQHDTENSLAVLSSQGYLLRCYTCECDKFEKCQLKKEHPEFHNF